MGIFSKRQNPYDNTDLSFEELYAKLKKYYENNDLYRDEQYKAYLTDTRIEAMKGLRTVVNRSVEFFVSKVLQNPKVSTENEVTKQAIEKFLKWSNFKANKSLVIRQLALYGDIFLKINTGNDKIYFTIIDPATVTKFKLDNRGYIVEIRIDVPIVVDERHLTHTEYWTKQDGYFSIWQHNQGSTVELDQLGDPIEYGALAELGIDFVPFVNVKFRDTGNERGSSCVLHSLDKVDEANRQATRLHQMLFRWNKPLWVASANMVDKEGRPVPAPKGKSTEIDVTDNSVISMPGMSTLNSLVPNIQYDAALNILNAQMAELEADLPELKYYNLKDQSNVSTKTVKTILASALDRAGEAQDNLKDGLIRLNEMALTIGSYFGLWNVGSYEAGDFDHEILCDDFFSESMDEKVTTLKMLRDSSLGLRTALKLAGFSDDIIEQAVLDAEEEQTKSENALANSLARFNGQ